MKCKLKVICHAFQKMRLFQLGNSKNMRLRFTITDKQLPILSCNYISDSRKYQENGNIWNWSQDQFWIDIMTLELHANHQSKTNLQCPLFVASPKPSHPAIGLSADHDILSLVAIKVSFQIPPTPDFPLNFSLDYGQRKPSTAITERFPSPIGCVNVS